MQLAFKSTVILATALLAVWMLRHKSAALRHQIWTLALFAVLALPFFSLTLPAWRIPLRNPVLPDIYLFQADARAGQSVATQAPAAIPPHHALNITALWLLGATLSLAQMALGWSVVARMRRKAPPLELPEFAALTTNIELRQGPPGSMPITYGKTILLPPDALTWSPDRRRAVLLHELAHVRRHDSTLQFFARFALVAYWWHPLAWFAWSQLLKERERAADDMVLNLGTNATDYASHLLAIARSMNAPRSLGWAAIAMARPSQLEGRLSAILDPKRDRRSPRLTASILALALVAPLAALQTKVEPTPNAVNGEPNSLIVQGKKALAAKDYVAATSFFEGALSSDPAHASMWLAVVQQDQDNAQGAADLYKSALDAAEPNSTFSATLMELYARVLHRLGRDEEATQMTEQASTIRRVRAEQVKSNQPVNPALHKMSEVTKPVLLSKVEPQYSDDARLAKYSGGVLLSIEIGADGVPVNVVVVRGLGLGLDEKAVEAVTQWRFKPATLDGEPVAVSAQVEVNFRLM
jgi:TonB family protein